MDPEFILITPARNEEKFLPIIIEAVLSGTKLPKIWLLVDDGSVDNTLNIMKKYSSTHSFIKFVSLNSNNVERAFRYSNVCIKGFDFIIEYCRSNSIDWSYIGVLDSDTIVTKHYFEDIIKKMEIDESVGVSSGIIYSKVKDRYIKERQLSSLPFGTGRIWRKSCFFDTDRYELSTNPDSVSNTKAFLKGWSLRIFEDVIAFQQRETSSSNGLLNGYVRSGVNAYFMSFNLLLVAINCANLLLSKNFVYVLPYLYGYLKSFISRIPQFEDPLIVYYNKYLRVKNIIRSINKQTLL